MIDSGPPETGSADEDSDRALPDWLVGLMTVEAIALLIGLAMPITPSKTGSTWSPAELLTPDPSYLTEVAVYFLMTNVLLFTFGLAVWISGRIRQSR